MRKLRLREVQRPAMASLLLQAVSSASLELAPLEVLSHLLFLLPSSPLRCHGPHLCPSSITASVCWKSLAPVCKDRNVGPRASLLCLGSTSYIQTCSSPSSPADGETSFTIHSSCTNFLPCFRAYNECLKTNIPSLAGQECEHLLWYILRLGCGQGQDPWNSAERAPGWEDRINSCR